MKLTTILKESSKQDFREEIKPVKFYGYVSDELKKLNQSVKTYILFEAEIRPPKPQELEICETIRDSLDELGIKYLEFTRQEYLNTFQRVTKLPVEVVDKKLKSTLKERTSYLNLPMWLTFRINSSTWTRNNWKMLELGVSNKNRKEMLIERSDIMCSDIIGYSIDDQQSIILSKPIGNDRSTVEIHVKKDSLPVVPQKYTEIIEKLPVNLQERTNLAFIPGYEVRVRQKYVPNPVKQKNDPFLYIEPLNTEILYDVPVFIIAMWTMQGNSTKVFLEG